MVGQEKKGSRAHILTIFITCAAIVAYCAPQFSALLVYDRQAVLSGELWRLLTAPLVHFSASHLFWDLLVFGAAGFAVKAANYRRFWMVCGFAAAIPGALYLLTLPDIERYGGLSGLATGAVAYLCLCSIFKSNENRFLWGLILLFMGIKIVFEAATGAPVFVRTGNVPFRVLPSVHVIGFLGALAVFIWPGHDRADAS